MIEIRVFPPLLAIAALSALTAVGPAAAQERPGRIDVVVREDARGAPLRGVTLTASGVQDATAVTDSHGEAHFVELPSGEYTVIARFHGYNDYHSINVPVATGTTVPLRIWMSIQGSARQVDTRLDAPAVDPRAHTASTGVSLDQLQRAPWNRDPWSVIQTVPAVTVDRVNVGGAESGQQFAFAAKGAPSGDNTWTLDGVPVTSMSALGSSSTYFDFGMLEEIRVTTGGASPLIPTPGVQVNVVLQSGGNDWRGSGRAYVGPSRVQSKNVSDSMRPALDSYSRAGDYKDFGAEGGGPIVRGRIFGWAGVGRTEPERRIYASGPSEAQDVEIARDSTSLYSTAAKATAALDANNRASFTYLRNHKDETGYGASATRPGNTVFDEVASASFYSASIDRRAGHDVFLSGRYAHVGNDLSLAPRSGGATFSTARPQDYAALDAYVFRRSHRLTFGAGWRRAKERSRLAPESTGTYWSAYAADTIVRDRLTIELAAKLDRARSAVAGDRITWNSVTPRVGAAYVVDDEQTTVVRGSYSIFPSQLAAAAITDVRARIGDYATPLTHEFVFGGDHALSIGGTVTALFTYRWMTSFNRVHYRGVTASDFVSAGRFTGSAPGAGDFDVPLFRVDPAAIPALLEPVYDRRDGYHQRYWGIEVAAVRRFSNLWAVRLAFSTNDHREGFDGPDAIIDPTPTLESPNLDGGMVMRRVDAPGVTGVFMLPPKYQFAGTASFTLRGMDASLSYMVRQGYATPFYASGVDADRLFPEGRNVLLVGDPGRARLPMAHTLDGRLSKSFATRGVHLYAVHLDLDVFNVLNRSIVLARGYDLSRANFNRVLGITNPRTIRLGLRVSF